jgi:CIC family chloride channel protein
MTALPVPPDSRTLTAADGSPGRDGAAGHHNGTAPPGPVTYQHDVQALFSSESLGQALRQLAVYGRDGLPVVSPDERSLTGWVTSAGVLRTLAHRVAGATDDAANAKAAADGEHEDAQGLPEHPSVPLPGYYVAEITITRDSPAAGRKLSDVRWPGASTPVSLLRGGSLRQPHRDTTLAAGDRVSLLIPAPENTESQGTEAGSVKLPQ